MQTFGNNVQPVPPDSLRDWIFSFLKGAFCSYIISLFEMNEIFFLHKSNSHVHIEKGQKAEKSPIRNVWTP